MSDNLLAESGPEDQRLPEQPDTQQTQQPIAQQPPNQEKPPKKQEFFLHNNKKPSKPSESAAEAADVPKSKKKFLIIPAVALIIILILIAALLLSHGGNGGAGESKGSAGQAQLLATLSSPGNQTPAGVMAIASKKLASTVQFNISYSGMANIRVKGGELGDLQFQIPLRINYEKYGNNSRFYINATGIPLIGNISAYYIGLANGTSYSCSALGGQFFSNMSSNASGRITCQASHSIGSNQYPSLLQSVQGQQGVRGTVKVIRSAVYNGQECLLTSIHGNGSIANSTASYNITTCLSGQYYVPLNLTATASTANQSGYAVSLSLDELSIGIPVTQSEVTSLPGPVANLTEALVVTTANATTIPNYVTPVPFVNGTTTCTPPYGNQNTDCLGFTMNQSRRITLSIETTDYNAYHISVWCEINQYMGAFVNSGFPVYYAINSTGLNSGKGTVGAANESGTASLLENMPINFTGLPCTAEATVPQVLAPGAQLSGTIWFNYKSLQSHGVNETGILASFNTTIK